MTEKAVTDEQIGKFARRVHDLQRRVVKGSVDFDRVMDGLQWITEGRAVEPKREHLPYEDEQFHGGTYGYPDGFRILSFDEQLNILQEFFPKLDASYVTNLANGKLPEGAEGWAVIPKPVKLGKNYLQALEKSLELLAQTRKFKIIHGDKLTQDHFRLPKKTVILQANLKRQQGDYLVFPFQFGKKWAGHSFRNAQEQFSANEFGLSPYELAILLLTHPKRITGEWKRDSSIYSNNDMKSELGLNCGGYFKEHDLDIGCNVEYWFLFQWATHLPGLCLCPCYPSADHIYSGAASAFLI